MNPRVLGVGLAILGGGALLLAAGGRREELGSLTYNKGVIVSDEVRAWLERFRAAVPARIPIHVNSGRRTEEQQARAMLTKLAKGDDLVNVYGDRPQLRRLLALPREVPAWTQEIMRQRREEGFVISRHLLSDAVDLRSQGRADDIAIATQAMRLGARAVIETVPPHVHLERVS